MILRSSEESVSEPTDRDEVRRHHESVLEAGRMMDGRPS
jgi:hypothetical protein